MGGLMAVVLSLTLIGSVKAQNQVINPDAVVAGKGLSRAGAFLDWTLGLYKGNGDAAAFFGKEKVSQGQTLRDLWWFSFKMCIFLYLAIAMIVGFSFIIKARWIDRWRRNLPWLIISIGAAAISYLVLTFFMQMTANAMAIFMKNIDANKLLNIQFSYDSVKGLTNADINMLEVVRNTQTLIKIATATAYGVGGMLLLRIVVLWMLTVIVPFVMPFVAFPVTQSLGKIWVREFIRWLMVGPMIALFLYVSNTIWTKGDFNTLSSSSSNSTYQSATELNIASPTNNASTFTVNSGGASGGSGMTSDSYTKYIISLIMLWVSIILPWILMRFALSYVTEATTKWYEKNRETAMVKQLERILRPQAPPPRPTGPAGAAQALKGRLSLPAREMHLAPAIAQIAKQESATRANTERVSSLERLTKTAEEFKPMSATNTLKLAGMVQTGETAEKLEQGKQKQRALSTMSEIEQQPALMTNVMSEISKLQNPETVKDQAEQQHVKDLKNNLVLNEGRADHSSRNIVATIKNDANKLAVHSVKDEMREKTYSTIQENATKVIQSGTIKDAAVANQIKQLTQLIAQFKQSTGGSKQTEKINLSQQIDKMAKTIASQVERAMPSKHEGQAAAYRQGEAMAHAVSAQNKKEAQHTAGGALNAPGGGLAAGLAVRQTDPGRALIKSLRFLNINELSYTSSDAGIGKLLVSEPDITNTVPDTEMITDYEESKQQWLKYYRTAPVPVSQNIKSRTDWIASQIASQQDALNKISAEDYNLRREGLSQLSKIMPFLLMGDYTLTEVILYLKAKVAAASQVEQEQKTGQSAPEEQETDKVELEKTQTNTNQQKMALDEPTQNSNVKS